MKKRILGIVLALVMALTFVPVTAEAADFDDREWYPLTQGDFDEFPLTTLSDYKYYLYQDITLDSTLTINGTVTLDLNGHVLKMTGNKSVLKVASGAEFTIQDSEPNTVHKFDKNAETGLLTLNEASGTETIRGGIITGGNTIQGAGITMDEGALSLTMTGGTIVGCQSSSAAGGILAWGRYTVPTITLSGSSRVTGCTAPAPYGSAIGVANEAVLNLYGGLVEGDVYIYGTIKADPAKPAAIYGDLYSPWGFKVENTLYVYGTIKGDPYGDETVFWSKTNAITYKNGENVYLSMWYPVGGTVTPPPAPEKNGFLFTGWLQADGTPYDFSAPAKAGLTILNAGWFDPTTVGGVTPQLKIGEDNLWYVSYDNGATWISLGVKATGDKGDTGATGEKGDKGDTGATGPAGKDGVTPLFRVNLETNKWEISYDNGETWTAYVQATGDKGDKGDQGDKGDKGDPGLIPYIGVNGNWWLGATDTGVAATGPKGDKGDTGATGATGAAGATGATGAAGAAGRDGRDGLNGQDGVGIVSAEINADGHLILTYTNGETTDLGVVVGADGLTPFIGDNGNWWIGELDTGVKAAASSPAASTATIIIGAAAGLALAGNIALALTLRSVLKKKELV